MFTEHSTCAKVFSIMMKIIALIILQNITIFYPISSHRQLESLVMLSFLKAYFLNGIEEVPLECEHKIKM